MDSSSNNGKAKTLKVYCCAECGEVQKKNTTPKIKGCLRASFHRWVLLGTSGNNLYTCKHCKITVRTDGAPSSYGCKEKKIHDWKG